MDTEQLKMILETLRTMGDAGHDAFVWWLLLDKGLPVVAWLLTFLGIMFLAKRLIDRIAAGGLGEQVRDMLNVGCPGPMLPSEQRETLQRLREMLDKQRGG